ncbi:MAG: tetratricopeptide repeat protein [Armatimonadetes bacterium]|nr:tetratricopeptide repeat protein [Armatimonadota bacterium]
MKRRRVLKGSSLHFRLLLFGIAGILLITAIAYVPAICNGFVWDDNVFIIESPIMNSPNALYRYWFTTDSPDYYPLVYTLFWIEYQIWGKNPIPYHIVSIFLHALASVLSWLVLRRLRIPGSWFAALIFAVHPVNVESVAWIFQQRTTMPMVFSLLTILAYLRFVVEGKARWYISALITFTLGLLSKTSVVMMPLVLLGCIWWESGKVQRRDIIRSIPFFVLAIAFGLVTAWVQSHRAIGEEVVRADNYCGRLAGAGWAVWFYLYKALIPSNLCFVYPRWNLDSSSIVSYIPTLAVFMWFWILWRYRRSWGRPLLMGFGYFVVTLLPVLGFLDIYFMRYSLVADHWQYISILGIIALVVGVIASFANRAGYAGKLICAVIGVFVVSLFMVLSWNQEKIYKNEETLWTDTIRKNPACWMAHNNLGRVLADKGKTKEAISHFKAVLHIKPDHVNAHFNIGVLMGEQGNLDVEIAEYRKALKIKPDFADAHNNLAVALYYKGRYAEAWREVELCRKYGGKPDPTFIEALERKMPRSAVPK